MREPLDAAGLRDKVGLRQIDVANAMNRRLATISDWETGKIKPKLHIGEVLALCKLYKVSLEELHSAFELSAKKGATSPPDSVTPQE